MEDNNNLGSSVENNNENAHKAQNHDQSKVVILNSNCAQSNRYSKTNTEKVGIISRTSDGSFDDPLLHTFDENSDDDGFTDGVVCPTLKYASSEVKSQASMKIAPPKTMTAAHLEQTDHVNYQLINESGFKDINISNTCTESKSSIDNNLLDRSVLTIGNIAVDEDEVLISNLIDVKTDGKRENKGIMNYSIDHHSNNDLINSKLVASAEGFVSQDEFQLASNSGLISLSDAISENYNTNHSALQTKHPETSNNQSAIQTENTFDELEFVEDYYKPEELVEPEVIEVVVKNGGRLWVGSRGGPMPEEGEVKGEGEELEVLTSDLSQELGEVGRYSYAGLVAHSLFVLFEYAQWHRKYQEELVKKLLDHLSLSKQLEATMLLLTGGEIDMETCEPFIVALKKDSVLHKEGLQCLPYDLVSIAVRDGLYDARTRSIAKFISLQLCISKRSFEAVEELVLKVFLEEQHQATEEELQEKKQRARKRKIKRAAIISVAAVGGGVLIGLTGGLAAPLIAAGIGAAVGTGGVILGSVAGIAIMGSLFGVAGAGLTGYKMNKRIGELDEFEFEPLTTGHSLHVTIVISGWLTAKHNDFKEAWYGLANSNEQYALRFESRYLKPLGDALEYIITAAISTAVKEGLKHTVLSGLLAAITWPLALISVASIIDNPWSICTQRSVNAGRQLAEVLLSRQQGKRPITLIGYSFGARVIFSCLQEMSKRKNSEGIVEEAILLGAPVTASVEEWSSFSRVVSGRIVNGYCRSDWLLKFMYRTASVQFSIAGLAPVEWRHRIMHNIDLSDIISGHLDYFSKMDVILDTVGIATKPHVPLGVADSLKQLSDAQKVGYNRMSQAGRASSNSTVTSNKNNLEKSVVESSQSGKSSDSSKSKKIEESSQCEKNTESLQYRSTSGKNDLGKSDKSLQSGSNGIVESILEAEVEPKTVSADKSDKIESIVATAAEPKTVLDDGIGSNVEKPMDREIGSNVEKPMDREIGSMDHIKSSIEAATLEPNIESTDEIGSTEECETKSTKSVWSGIETLV